MNKPEKVRRQQKKVSSSIGIQSIKNISGLQLKEQIIDRAADSIILRDLDGDVIYANEVAYTSRGYSREEFLRLKPYHLGTPEANKLLEPMKEEALKKGIVYYQTTHVCKDSSLLPVEIELRPIEFGGRMLMLSIIHDITERKRAEEELYFKEQILNKSTDSIIIRDATARIIFANEAAYQSRGYTQEEFLNMTIYQLIAPEQQERTDFPIGYMEKPGSLTFESLHIRKDGSLMPVEVNRNIIEFGGKMFSVTIARDITDRKKAEEALRLKEKILDSATDSIVLREPDGTICYVNEMACRFLGYSREELIGMNVRQLLPPEEVEIVDEKGSEILSKESITFESVDVRKDGTTIPVEVRATTIESGGKRYFMAITRDITERKKTEEYIRQLAYYDTLTGLPNRTLFNDRFDQALAHAARYKHKLAVLVMDLDHFKEVNDSLGHAAGDNLIKEIATRLSMITRKVDTVCRMGGDEFLLLLSEIKGEEDASAVAQKIIETIRKPVVLVGKEIQVTASIGVSVYPDCGRNLDTLLSNADDAMYQVKRSGRNAFQHYSLMQADRRSTS